MILIAIGANLPTHHGSSALQTCQQAVEKLRAVAGVKLTALSHWYETEALPPSDQPVYINGIVAMDATLNPGDLLQMLHSIEATYGRERTTPNAARTLDLDIIDMGGLIRTSPPPILPHPRAHLRAFVLRPLLDVAPHWRHPVSGLTARALLDALPGQYVRRVACSHLRDGDPTPN